MGALLVTPRIISAARSEEKWTVYIDESGNLGQGPFVVGALVMANPDRHLEQFSAVRKQLKYRLTLRYGSSDKHKLSYARRLVEYFFREQDLRFCAYALAEAKNNAWPRDPKIREIAYHDLYRSLLDRCAGKHQKLSLNLKQRTTTGEDRFLHDYLKTKFARIDKINVLRAYQNDLIQFADLLAGSIAADKTQPDDETKRTLLNDLRNHLSVNSLWENSLAKNNKFCVTVIEG